MELYTSKQCINKVWDDVDHLITNVVKLTKLVGPRHYKNLTRVSQGTKF